MATTSMKREIQSVQRNIAFLKKEQSELLHELHLEILRLQKHCTELTHDLKTRQVELKQQDGIEQQLLEKCRIIEIHLGEKEKTNSELQQELWHRETLVLALRSDLKEKERKFLDELKSHSHRITILNTELQKQTEAATYLSFQLHSTMQMLHSSRHNVRQSDRLSENAFSVPLVPECKAKKQTHKVHLPRRPALKSTLTNEMLRDAAQIKMSNSEVTDLMPDPSVFLDPKRNVPSNRQQCEPRLQAPHHHKGFTWCNHVATPGHKPQMPEELTVACSAMLLVNAKLTNREGKSCHVFTHKGANDSELNSE
ncbi:coiled-coil domain-containing 92B [Ambystoma mexicanum]|uniref:coiled-coil domain-containing 92B n=1 Tax=Ambystoma mexicanum TaxID=8296 RepID=UPI0037E8E62E